MNTSLLLVLCLASCGYVYASSLRIVNGDEVERNSIPYQAHLFLDTDFGNGWNCTGVLISENYVLTTSKCQWSGASKVNVTLGVHNVREAEETQQVIYSRKGWKIYNAEFVYATLENNIALVKLSTPATLSEYVQVAKLATSDDVTVGQTGSISGWGINRGDLETVLSSASVTVIENSVCAAPYETFYIGDKTICVQGDNGASACNGDGGAPLVIDGIVVGLYSGGPAYIAETHAVNCADKPNTFTKVASYLDWIKENSDYE